MPANRAAYLVAKHQKPLEVREAPYNSPGSNEVVVKNAAFGINPVDAYLQEKELWPMNYPIILGCDLAGTIEEVGQDVTRFKKGDRVIGNAIGGLNFNRNAAFQDYTVLPTNLVSEIPPSVSFEAGCAIPLGLSTSGSGMYQKDFLGLPHPSVNPKPTGTTLLVWSGASSLGTQAIQLARASGCEVIATASPHNFDMVKKLGASQVFDYKSPTVISDLIQAFRGKTIAGAYPTAGENSVQACIDVVAQCEGNKFVASALPYIPETLPEGVSAKFIFGSTLKDNEVGDAVYKDYLPDAFVQGKFVASPEPEVIGKGLEEIQKALDTRRAGNISAKKLVVVL